MLHISGAEEWRSTTEFPPASGTYQLYLNEGHKLSAQPPKKGISSSSFVFDPRDPTPTMGGNTLGTSSGRVEDTALSKRADVLSFTSEPLEEDLEVVGQPSVQLVHSTDVGYADLFVRLSEVNGKGASYNISEAYVRLDPKRETGTITLALSWCAHKFAKGWKMRLVIAGASHPHFARNLGVENLDNTGSDMRAVEHTVFHEIGKISKLII